MKRILSVVMVLALGACGQNGEQQRPSQPGAVKAAKPTAPKENIGMALVVIGSSADLLEAQANLAAMGAGYDAVQLAADAGKNRSDALESFDSMIEENSDNPGIVSALQDARSMYAAFCDEAAPKAGEPAGAWRQRLSHARHDFNVAAARLSGKIPATN